jgi:hypothetical protein
MGAAMMGFHHGLDRIRGEGADRPVVSESEHTAVLRERGSCLREVEIEQDARIGERRILFALPLGVARYCDLGVLASLCLLTKTIGGLLSLPLLPRWLSVWRESARKRRNMARYFLFERAARSGLAGLRKAGEVLEMVKEDTVHALDGGFDDADGMCHVLEYGVLCFATRDDSMLQYLVGLFSYTPQERNEVLEYVCAYSALCRVQRVVDILGCDSEIIAMNNNRALCSACARQKETPEWLVRNFSLWPDKHTKEDWIRGVLKYCVLPDTRAFFDLVLEAHE